jgi:FAD synthase
MSDDGLRERVAELLRDCLVGTERIQRNAYAPPPEWTELLLGRRNVVCVPTPDHNAPITPLVLFPGSFNPLHRGHERMAKIAAERLSEAVWFEISIANVDKPPLDFLTIRERLDQLGGYSVCLTRAATFVEKAELFPGATFVVGADTLSRIADERYYGGSRTERDAALARLVQAGVRFLVFGRTVGNRFTTLADLTVPSTLAGLCEEVPKAEFREDVASTQIRAKSTHV